MIRCVRVPSPAVLGVPVLSKRRSCLAVLVLLTSALCLSLTHGASVSGGRTPPRSEHKDYIQLNMMLSELHRIHRLRMKSIMPYNLTLRYEVRGGLGNQLDSHSNAIALAAALGAHSLIFPTSKTRDSFAHSYKDAEFECVDPSVLFDVDATRDALYGFFKVRLIVESCDNATGIGTYDADVTAKLPHQTRHEDVPSLDGTASVLQRYLSTRLKRTTPSTVLLRVDPFLAVKWDDAMAYMRFATVDLMRWAPRIQFLVSNVLHGIRKECGPKDISGVHLRLEGDAGPWLARSSSYTNLTVIPTDHARARGWKLYLDRLIAYDMLPPGGPLYLSTGLVKSSTEDPYAATLMGIITQDLQQRGTCIVYQGKYVATDTVSNIEASLIDFIIMKMASKVLLTSGSTFSSRIFTHRFDLQTDPNSTHMLTILVKNQGSAVQPPKAKDNSLVM